MFGDTAAESDSIPSTNKLFVSSSKHAFQENCIKNSFLLKVNVYETKYIMNSRHFKTSINHHHFSIVWPQRSV